MHPGLVLVLTPLLRSASCSWSRIPTTTRPRTLNASSITTQRIAVQLKDPPLVAVTIWPFIAAAIQADPTQASPTLTRTRWVESKPHSLALQTSRPRTTRCGVSRLLHLLPLRCPPCRFEDGLPYDAYLKLFPPCVVPNFSVEVFKSFCEGKIAPFLFVTFGVHSFNCPSSAT